MIAAEHVQAIERAALAHGDLRVLMTRTQLRADRKLRQMQGRTFVVDCSRRWGKTIWSAIKVHQWAKRPNAVLRYCAPTKNHGRQFVIPAFEWVGAKIPASMRPHFDRQANTWHWDNGAVCHLGSAETMSDVEAQVGTECHGAIADEAGKVRSDLLKHWHRSVILPQFLTTDGVCIVPSTPPLNQGHYFAELAKANELRGSYARYTIEDCDHVSLEARHDVIREIIAPESSEWEPWMDDAARAHPDIRRELYCEHISDPTRMIVPEWQSVADECVADVERPEFVDWYCAADFGFHDLTVVLWGYSDFRNSRLVITHELAMHRSSGLDVGFRMKEIEAGIGAKRIFRCADAPPQMLADLVHPTRGPGIVFAPALKDDSDAALNHVRMLIQRKRIVIAPSCTTLISHLANGTWNAGRTSFERIEGYGHWDAIDALKYMVRAVNWRKNPEPVLHPSTDMANTFVNGNVTPGRTHGTRRVLNRRHA